MPEPVLPSAKKSWPSSRSTVPVTPRISIAVAVSGPATLPAAIQAVPFQGIEEVPFGGLRVGHIERVIRRSCRRRCAAPRRAKKNWFGPARCHR